MFNWLAVRSGQWRPSRRVVEIILKHDLLGLSVEALPGATPFEENTKGMSSVVA